MQIGALKYLASLLLFSWFIKAYYDTAIIELEQSVRFEFNVFPICLPQKANVDPESWKGLPVTISGKVIIYKLQGHLYKCTPQFKVIFLANFDPL